MNHDADNIITQKSTISVTRIVLIQSIVTVVGFVLFFGFCTKQFIRYQFSQIDGKRLQSLQFEQEAVASQQKRFDVKGMHALLERVCASMACIVEDMESTVNTESLPIESLKIITTVDLVDIPILLDVFRAHPYGFTLEGLEVHAYEQPVKMQVRLSRVVLPEKINTPDWIEQIGWSTDEINKVQTLYASWLINHWQDRMLVERDLAATEWRRLYQTLNRDLWYISQQETALVYTRTLGTSIKDTGIKDSK